MITDSGLKFSIIFKVIWKRILFLTVLSTAVVISYDLWADHLDFPNIPLAIFGTLLAILLGFRVNNAYQRWWEARKLWGKIVNDSRSVSRMFISFLGKSHPNIASQMVKRQIGYCWSLRNHLRGLPKEQDLAQHFDPEELDRHLKRVNVPNAIMCENSLVAADLERAGELTPFQQQLLEDRFSLFLDSQGGCERIKKTVFPYDYRFYTTFFVHVFSTIFPFIIVDEADWQTIPWTVFFGFALSSIDHLAKAIENPFENRVNDTAMNAISRTIEIDLLQMLKEQEIPEPVKPVDGYLM